MDALLSNSIVKAYIKKDKRKIAFHLFSHLLIPAKSDFNPEDLTSLNGCFILGTGHKISFTKCFLTTYNDGLDYSYYNNTKAIKIHLNTIQDFKSIYSGLIDIEVLCHLCSVSYHIKTKGLLIKMYDERTF